MSKPVDQVASETVDELYTVPLKVRPRWRRALRLPRHIVRLKRIHGVTWGMACRLAWITVSAKF